MNRTPVELIYEIYGLLDSNGKRALRRTTYRYLQMLPSPPIPLLVNVDQEQLQELTDDVEKFRAVGGGRLITRGYAGIKELAIEGDYMDEGLNWDRISRAVLFLQVREILFYRFPLQTDGAWDPVCRLVGPECRALTLVGVSNFLNLHFSVSLMRL